MVTWFEENECKEESVTDTYFSVGRFYLQYIAS